MELDKTKPFQGLYAGKIIRGRHRVDYKCISCGEWFDYKGYANHLSACLVKKRKQKEN